MLPESDYKERITGIQFHDDRIYVSSSGIIGGSVFFYSRSNLEYNGFVNGMDDTFFEALITTDTVIYCGTVHKGLYKRNYNDSIWKRVDMFGYSDISLLYKSNHGLFVSTEQGLYRSFDDGFSWSKYDNGIPSSGLLCYSMASNEQEIFRVVYRAGVYKTDINDSIWSQVTNGIPRYDNYGFNVITYHDGFFFASVDTSLYKLKSGDSVWAPCVRVGVPSNSWLTSLCSVPPMGLIACSYTRGLFMTQDLGETWVKVNSGLVDSLHIVLVTIDSTNLYVGTDGYGVWMCPLEKLTANETPKDYRNEIFILKQNYPNPFNPTTTIEYHVPEGIKGKLMICSVDGKMIKDIDVSGKGAYLWKADSRIASGMYVCRLSWGGKVTIKKMVLAR